MATLCVVSQGIHIRHEGRRLLLHYPDKTVREIPLLNIERIFIFGNAEISTSLLGYLCEQGIDISLLTVHGKFRGRLGRGFSKNIYLREAQYRKSFDREFVFTTAKIIIQGKIKNQREQLMRFKRNHPDADIGGVNELERFLKETERKISLNALRGMEGIAAKIYFNDFKAMLLKETDFEKRVRRPPGDKINALLSLGYTFLVNEMTGILEAIGFDPYKGFLHETSYGRVSLSLDLIEEFRVPVVDRLVLEGFNKSIFSDEDFKEGNDENNRKTVLLTEPGMKKFLSLWEKKVGKIGRKAEMDLTHFRKAFRDQGLLFAGYIRNENTYTPFEIG
ncbi:MAG: CRISPR-associated endonuclease Cas1 [Spirochaetales bacterium]|nr:CRISPR-associated endonuclease Cas1 [Spirochaetales bacterium]